MTGGAVYVAVTYTAFVEQDDIVTAWYQITDICSGLLLLCEYYVASFLLLVTVMV